MSQAIINNRFLEESVFAIADGYCVINLTKNIVRGSMYQVVNGKKYNLNEQLGLPENSSLQSLSAKCCTAWRAPRKTVCP